MLIKYRSGYQKICYDPLFCRYPLKKERYMRLVFSVLAIVCSVFVYGQGDINKTDANGKKEGPWQKKYKNGKIKYTGQFKAGQPVGEFKRYTNKGKLSSTLNYSSDSKSAAAHLYHPNGKTLASGTYLGQKKEGLWIFYAKKGHLFSKVNYKDGNYEGDYKEFYKPMVKRVDTVIAGRSEIIYDTIQRIHFHRQYKNGVLTGKAVEYFDNGNMRVKKNYEGGLPTGPFVSYHMNGVYRVMGKYINGKKQGTWKFYSDKLKLEKEEKYKGGEMVYTSEEIITYWNDSLKIVRSREKYDEDARSYFKAYHQNGNLYREGYFFNGKKDSTWQYFNPTGRLDTIRTFYRGMKNGHWTINHPNGKPRIEQSWSKNKLEGKYEEYFSTGQIKVSGNYHNGQPSGEWKYFDAKGTLVQTKKHGKP
jgi:antitoxin component YwqK of YwqJK toxin-antitoxin module